MRTCKDCIKECNMIKQGNYAAIYCNYYEDKMEDLYKSGIESDVDIDKSILLGILQAHGKDLVLLWIEQLMMDAYSDKILNSGNDYYS
jgi:hypothetical protein